MRVGGDDGKLRPSHYTHEGRRDDGELRPWHYIYVYGIERRLMRRVIYESKCRNSKQLAEMLAAAADVVRAVAMQRARGIAFAMGLRERLGAASLVRHFLNPEP